MRKSGSTPSTARIPAATTGCAGSNSGSSRRIDSYSRSTSRHRPQCAVDLSVLDDALQGAGRAIEVNDGRQVGPTECLFICLMKHGADKELVLAKFVRKFDQPGFDRPIKVALRREVLGPGHDLVGSHRSGCFALVFESGRI